MMTYRIVDVATNARVGNEIIDHNAKWATAKAHTLARLAGGSFRGEVQRMGWWRHCVTVNERIGQ